MSSVKGTETEKNLLKAFAGESQAAARYGFFAKKAKKEGFEAIAGFLTRVSEEERAHASVFFKFLEPTSVELTVCLETPGNRSTLENLKAAIAGEHEEVEMVYPAYARTARDEGFDLVARAFEGIAVAEAQHEAQHAAYVEYLETGTLFKRDKPVVWRCRQCGFVVVGTEAPAFCTACSHPQAYFEASVN